MTDNPMGLDGFEFVEFSGPHTSAIERVFTLLGFDRVARHRSKAVQLWRQGEVNFVLNAEPRAPAAFHAAEHGPSVCGLAFRVRDAHVAWHRALALGAQPVDIPTGPMELKLPAIRGIGGMPIYLIDRYADGSSIYDIDFEYLPDAERHPAGVGLLAIDHLTHNVYRGRMDYWADFYHRFFNFEEMRRFDIAGEQTGLASRAMAAPDGRIRIPLNEETRGAETGQIEEFLMQHNGEGVQHIALSCHDLPRVLGRLRERGVELMPAPPEQYYEALETRLPGHGECAGALRESGILIDGDTSGEAPRLLLQVFSQPMVGPLFFEFIERKGDEGFGEGNFQALFDSLEQEQMARRVIRGAA